MEDRRKKIENFRWILPEKSEWQLLHCKQWTSMHRGNSCDLHNDAFQGLGWAPIAKLKQEQKFLFRWGWNLAQLFRDRYPEAFSPVLPKTDFAIKTILRKIFHWCHKWPWNPDKVKWAIFTFFISKNAQNFWLQCPYIIEQLSQVSPRSDKY